MTIKNYVAGNERNQHCLMLRLNVFMELKLTSIGRLFRTLITSAATHNA